MTTQALRPGPSPIHRGHCDADLPPALTPASGDGLRLVTDSSPPSGEDVPRLRSLAADIRVTPGVDRANGVHILPARDPQPAGGHTDQRRTCP